MRFWRCLAFALRVASRACTVQVGSDVDSRPSNNRKRFTIMLEDWEGKASCWQLIALL